ncbi:myb-like protein X [Brachionichthys hirsutus]|uniref:myb-like protein X n=1 Tax=Brachionichthys hirsutus TaxID=412623 RepID=UPI003604E193
MFRKSPKPVEAAPTDKLLPTDPPDGAETLSENAPTKEKGGLFSGMFKKSPKLSEDPRLEEGAASLQTELSSSTDSLSENKEKGSLFSGLLRKTPKTSGEENVSARKDPSASSDDLPQAANAKEKQGSELSGSNEALDTKDKEAQKEPAGSVDDLSENSSTKEKSIFSNLFKKPQKPAEDAAADQEKKGGLTGIFKRSASIENILDEEKGGLFSGLIKKTAKTPALEAGDNDDWKELTGSVDSLSGNPKEKKGGLAGIFKKPKLAERSAVTTDPLQDTMDLSSSWDSLVETAQGGAGELSASAENLCEAGSGSKQEKKGGFGGIFRRTPKTIDHQDSKDTENPEGGGLRRKRTIKKKTRVVSFRVKKTQTPKFDVALGPDRMSAIEEEAVEMRDLKPAQESSEELVVQPVEMAAYPTEHDPAAPEEEADELMQWWNTVKGWTEWNEASNFSEDEGEMAMEQAADRVYMAARLFVRLFNQRGASLQHRILELLALADASDQFHKKTVSAAVGGGVASVAGSVATITGLILAPFTFGASIIVTAVGIGVATAGSITSATANITDTVHSNMDRKKLEKMIQGYQDEIKVIRECMEFVQAGMNTLDEWDFEKYSQSATKKALNHNLKHVMKEGGRAGKALMINTDKLISTVQILGVAGGAAKAAQAISVTTGVMSALFLALDVFFLAKDSHDLRKGAKTKFATKIRDVCKELQDGLLELNKVKTQLQKTMDGIEVEEYEEIKEVEVEVDHDFESDPEKLAELDQELDLLEEKLDKKAEEEQEKKKRDELEKQNLKNNKEDNEEKSSKESREPKGKKEKEEGKGDDKKSEKKGEGKNKYDSKLEEDKEQKRDALKGAKEEDSKEQPDKDRKKKKETENRATAGKEQIQSKKDVPKEESGAGIKTGEKEREREWNKTGNEHKEGKIGSGRPKQEEGRGKTKIQRGSDEGVMNKEEGTGRMWRHGSSSSDKEKPPRRESESKPETRGSHRTESWRRTEEDRGERDERGEVAKSRGEKRETGRTESHQRHEASWIKEHSGREGGGRPEESDSRRGAAPEDERRGSKIESMRSRFERAGAEDRGKREGEGEGGSQRKDRDMRANDGDLDHHHHHHHHGQRGSRRQSRKLLEDGLHI